MAENFLLTQPSADGGLATISVTAQGDYVLTVDGKLIGLALSLTGALGLAGSNPACALSSDPSRWNKAKPLKR